MIIRGNLNGSSADHQNIALDGLILEKQSDSGKSFDGLCNHILNHRPDIRFVGICDISTCEFDVSFHDKNKKLLLGHKEKTMMLQISWKGSMMRNGFKSKFGRVIYAAEKYEKINRVTIPLNERNKMLFVTTEANISPEDVMSTIPKDILKNVDDPTTVVDERNTDNFMKSYGEYRAEYRLCEKIIGSDPKFRTSTICDSNGKLKSRLLRPGVKPYLPASENTESILQHSKRWKFRKKFVDKIGKCEYAYAVYQRIRRVTIPLDNDDLLLVTTEPQGVPEQTIAEVQELIRQQKSAKSC